MARDGYRMSWNNKVAIVTGASTGIGRAISISLANKGVKVLLVARTKSRLVETKRLIDQRRGKSEIFEADLSDIKSINNIKFKIKSRFKRIDILVNGAGVWHGDDEAYVDKDFDTYSQKIILDTYTVGVVAPTLLAHAVIPLMGEGGKVINISGTFEDGAKGWLPYFVSKKALEDLTIGLAEELMSRNIQVNAVSPSDTATEAFKKYFPQYVSEAIEPEEVAQRVVYLCSMGASKITGKVFVVKKGKASDEGYHT